MKSWTKLLPFFLVKIIAKRNLEVSVITVAGERIKVVRPYKDVYIQF